MTGILTKPRAIKKLERQLEQQSDELQQLVLIDQLAAHFAFTDVVKAQQLLVRQLEILQHHDLPDFRFNYHFYTAFIENQLYNFRLSEIHYQAALELVEDRGNATEQMEVYIDYAGLCINQNRLKEAEIYIARAEKILQTFPNQLLQARVACRYGYLNLHLGDYESATSYFLEADRMLSMYGAPLNYKDFYFQTLIYSGLGNVYERTADREKQVRSYMQAANLCETMGMRTRLAWHYYLVGNCLVALGDDEGAVEYLEKAIGIEDDISQKARAGAYATLGMIWSMRKQFQHALDLFNQAEKLYLEILDEEYHNYANLERLRGNLYLELGKYSLAIKHLKSAYKYAYKIKDYRLLSVIYSNIALVYVEEKDFKNAYDYEVLARELSEEAAIQVNRQKIRELEVRYEVEQNKKERELLRLQTVELQGKALRAQMNPHFVFNALNSIQEYISRNDTDAAIDFLADFAHLMRKSLEYSEIQHITIEEELEFIEDYLKINERLRFEDRLKYNVYVDDEIEEDIMGIPTLIVQPYVENAIEHGLRAKKDGLVTVKFTLIDDDNVLCIVEDNGVGRAARRDSQLQDPTFKDRQSMGTRITRDRLAIAHGDKNREYVKTLDLLDETGTPSGTRVELIIPVTDLHL